MNGLIIDILIMDCTILYYLLILTFHSINLLRLLKLCFCLLDYFSIIAGKVDASSWPATELCFLPLKILTRKGVYYRQCYFISIDKFGQLFKEENNVITKAYCALSTVSIYYMLTTYCLQAACEILGVYPYFTDHYI